MYLAKTFLASRGSDKPEHETTLIIINRLMAESLAFPWLKRTILPLPFPFRNPRKPAPPSPNMEAAGGGKWNLHRIPDVPAVMSAAATTRPVVASRAER